MILAFALALAVAGVVAVVLGRATRRGRLVEAPRPAAEGGGTAAPHDALPCTLGDVIVLASGEEAWLAGGILLLEPTGEGDLTHVVAAVYVAPERGQGRAIFARVLPEPSLDWLVPAAGVVVGAEPPSALEHDGVRFERVRRAPYATRYVGEGPPLVGAEVVVGEYDGGAGGRLLVVVGAGAPLVFVGRRLEAGMYDRLPGR